jgi:hypothetical protein
MGGMVGENISSLGLSSQLILSTIAGIQVVSSVQN